MFEIAYLVTQPYDGNESFVQVPADACEQLREGYVKAKDSTLFRYEAYCLYAKTKEDPSVPSTVDKRQQ